MKVRIVLELPVPPKEERETEATFSDEKEKFLAELMKEFPGGTGTIELISG